MFNKRHSYNAEQLQAAGLFAVYYMAVGHVNR